jgi:hypothetical protein
VVAERGGWVKPRNLPLGNWISVNQLSAMLGAGPRATSGTPPRTRIPAAGSGFFSSPGLTKLTPATISCPRLGAGEKSSAEEVAMKWKAFLAIAAVTPLGVLSNSSAAQAAWCDYYYCKRGFVIPCSLDGVNPAYHPSIFGNPAIAWRDYGFVRSPDGGWHVERSCVRGPYHGG